MRACQILALKNWRVHVKNFIVRENFRHPNFPRSFFFTHSSKMLIRTCASNRPMATRHINWSIYRPTIYLPLRASASSAAQTQPGHGSDTSEQAVATINIRQYTKTFTGKRWTTFSIPEDGDLVKKISYDETASGRPLNLKESILLTRDNALATFLPRGYPHSVTPEYKGFAYWQMWHNLAGSVTSGKVDVFCFNDEIAWRYSTNTDLNYHFWNNIVLSMQSMLYAIGLGAGSIPVSQVYTEYIPYYVHFADENTLISWRRP